MTKDQVRSTEEALNLALEALLINCGGNTEGIGKEAITAIKQALDAPVQEPVAWMHWLNGPCRVLIDKDEAMMELDRLNREYPADSHARKMRPLVFGDTTPPAAQRKPLTLGQKQRLWSSVGDKSTLKDRVNAYGFAIEAAHGIKENT